MKYLCRTFLLFLCMLSCLFMLFSCNDPTTETGNNVFEDGAKESTKDPEESGEQNFNDSETEPEFAQDDFKEMSGFSVKLTSYDLDTKWDETSAKILLEDAQTEIIGTGARFENGSVIIEQPGKYVLSGKMTDGQIVVSVDALEKVHLIFNGIDIRTKVSPAIHIMQADKTIITLEKGTTNYLEDTANCTDLEANACLYSKDDLTINGTGRLVVKGNYRNGIGTKDDLKIISGDFEVTALQNALKGNDSVAINSGTIVLKSDKDGIKSDKEDDPQKGFIYIRGGKIHIEVQKDALQAFRAIFITAGDITVKAKDIYQCDGIVDIAEGCLLN